MKGLEFLKSAKLVSNEVIKPAVARTSSAKAKIPETADLRIWKDGAIYPSAALVAEYDLQYRRAEVEDKGNGFDVFKSSDYPNTEKWPVENRIIFIAPVSKDAKEGRVDLFASTRYNKETGDPADVLTQGAATFGEQLLEWIKDTYNEIPNEEGFIDLVIARTNGFNTDNGKYYIPKVVSRGEKKGESGIVTRENITLYPLVPASWADETTEESIPEPEAKVAAAMAKPTPDTAPAQTDDAISRGSVKVDAGAEK